MRTKTLSFLLAAFSLASSSVMANDIEPGKEHYTVIRAPAPIVLDGNLSEWEGVPVLADPKFSIPKGAGSAGTYVLFEEYSGGTWTGPDDQTSAVQVVYDADNVYFGFVVTDDYHENSANSAWNGDSIQLMIASADRTAKVALYNYALGGIEGALGSTIVMHEEGPGGTEAVVTRNSATKRTTYEIKLPKASLGLTALGAGTQFGLGMAINDGDDGPGQAGQKGWGGLGAHALVFGKSPQETALMTLAAPPAPTNDIEPGKETYTVSYAPRPVVLDGNLGEWGGVPVLADPKFSVPKGSGPAGTGNYVLFEEYSGGTWTGPDDQTSAVQVIYDADNVYFGFVVTDDYHENSANSAWNGDSVQLMIANADRTAKIALYNYALGGIEEALGSTIVMHEEGPGGTEAVVTRNSATKRTTYEIKLPKASLGLTELSAGTRFGLGMAINDGDAGPGQAGQKGWGGLGAHALVFGKSPQETALMTLAAPPPPSSNDIEPGKEYYTVVRKPNPIVLDGDLSEWNGVPVIADPKFATPKGSKGAGTYVLFEEYAGGTWTGPDDQTSAVQVVYDADNVYFGFVVTDDYHENSANSAWNGDSVQLMIASADRTAKVALYNYALGGIEGALGDTIIMHEEGPGGTEAVVRRNSATKRTTYEIKLPKSSLGLTDLAGGTQFGLGMAINDGDAGPGQAGQKGWGGLGAHALVFGKSPQETALMTLKAYNDIEPGKDSYTATAAKGGIAIDGSLSEWNGVPVLADPKFSVPKGSGANNTGNYVLFEEYAGGTWTGPDDQTSAVQIVYDADNVYFGFVVTDDYHENSANSAWNGDSIQLMIATADRQNKVALYNYALGGIESALGSTIVMHEEGPGGTTAVVVRDSLNKKTTYEIKLPASSMGLIPPLTLGTKFGLGMAINDGDNGPGQEGQKGWGGLGAHALVFGKSPQETALVTLGASSSSGATIFLSAVNPAIDRFSFRANDKGTALVAPATAKLRIDGRLVDLTASPRVLDAIDFVYTPAPPFAPGNHTYAIEVQDTAGNVVTDSGSFVTPSYISVSAGDRALSVNTGRPGFTYRIFQNHFPGIGPNSLARAAEIIAGTARNEFGDLLIPDDNLVDATAIGVAADLGVRENLLVRFEIPTVINLSQVAGESNGDFVPDDAMPGIPGVFTTDDGIAVELVTFVELPLGQVTFGVNSDDGFRVEAGRIEDPAGRVLLAESEGPAATTFKFVAQAAGVYALRTLYYENTGSAHLELYTFKRDGTKVLLNDTANGGLRSYSTGVPAGGGYSVEVRRAGAAVEVVWSEPDTALQESSDLRTWVDVGNAASPYRPVIPAGASVKFYRLRK